MGQGYSHTILPAGPIEVPELVDLTFEKVLGGARFLRTVRARQKDIVVAVKICTKSNTAISFKSYARQLREERRLLAQVPNVLTYSRIIETSNFGILVRQFIHNSLYDRISIRPFLENIEKKWIAYQLVCAVRDCHAKGVFHGDIKSENVLVTSWGWVFLTDFSSAFKPVYLPEDNPADFSFYFDTSARRTCYLAPERFAQKPQEEVQWNMDIFSLGCVLAELFTEAPIFTLSQLFKYRRGEYDPTVPLLNKIDDEHIRALIGSMIKLNAEDRWHAQDYLDEYKGKAFPLYFYQHFDTLMQEITFPHSAPDVQGLADTRIDRIYNDYVMLSVSLGYEQDYTSSGAAKIPLQSVLSSSRHTGFPLQVDLPGSRHTASAKTVNDGTLILLNVITASVRNVERATSKVRACELMLAFAERLSDEAKLDRILPYVMPLLEDSNELVLITALRTMTQLLALVKVTSPVNSCLFTQYIFPRLQSFVATTHFRKHATVRATYAACLATMAETASRFLSMIQALRADGSLPDNDLDDAPDAYDATRNELVDQFEAQTKVFLTDNDSAVRRAFLSSVTGLCAFFGESKASDIILTHLNTYLNDTDWVLKCAFFKTIVGVSVYLGPASIEDLILPLMLQALTDPQDFVVEQAIRSLASMAELGLLQRPKTWELIDTIARFTMHPTQWIREAAAHFVSATTTFLSVADVRILATPLIAPYLKIPVASLYESELLDALKKPLPRAVLDLALSWASHVDRGVFWKSAKDSRQLSYHGVAQMPPKSTVADYLKSKALARVPKNDEDEQYISRLRSAGMHDEDEFKFLAFREYIWRVAHRRRDEPTKNAYDEVVKLAKLKIRPHTILFDNDPATYMRKAAPVAADEALVQSPAAAELPIIPNTSRDQSNTVSPSPSSSTGLSRDVDRALRNKDGRAGLLLGNESKTKASAEVGTVDAIASGKLEISRAGAKRPAGLGGGLSSTNIHNYEGHDPNVLKMLDNVYVDTFPLDVAEFGPIIQASKKTAILGGTSGALWRPQGRLTAVLNEHAGKIVSLLVSPDHSFFLSASEDGSVKVWDTERLERNISHRSRATHRMGAKVTSMCLIDSTHAFVSAGADGSIHVVKVEVSEAGKDSGHSRRYGKLKVCRQWKVPGNDNEYAVCLEHYRREAANILMIATNLNRVLAIDLRRMESLFELHISAQHGAILSFCVGRKQDWLLVGTSCGVLELWDLRFQIRLRSWSFLSGAPITRMQLHPNRRASRRNRVCISGGTNPGEVSVWDIEKGICTQVYRPIAGAKVNLRNYELRSLEDESHSSALAKDKKGNEAMFDITTASAALSTAFMAGQQPSPKDPEAMVSFVITGGPDNKVRFWDLDHLEGCRLVSGGNVQDEPPSYAVSTLGLDIKILSEKINEQITPGAVESAKVTPELPAKRDQTKLSRYDQIRLSSQQLLNGHLDTVTDVAMLELPFGMIVSGDRSGQIFIHQ